MTQTDIINYIENLKKSVEDCDVSAIIATGTATGSNVGSLMKGEISSDTFRKNSTDIAFLAIDYMQKCKCEKITL